MQHLRKINDVNVEEIKTRQIRTHAPEYKNLSDVDLSLLETAKKENLILVTDDKKLEKAARSEGVQVLDTPRLILAFSFGDIITYEKAREILGGLTYFYNRLHSIKRALKHLEEWR